MSNDGALKGMVFRATGQDITGSAALGLMATAQQLADIVKGLKRNGPEDDQATTIRDGAALRRYLYYRDVMALFRKTLSGVAEAPEQPTEGYSPRQEVADTEYVGHLRHTRLKFDPATQEVTDGVHAGRIVAMHEYKTMALGYENKRCPAHIVQVECDPPESSFRIVSADMSFQEGSDFINYRDKVVIRPDGKQGHYARTPEGATVTSETVLYDSQVYFLRTVANAMLSGRMDIPLHMATGGGKSLIFAVLGVATGKGGVYATIDPILSGQFAGSVRKFDADCADDDIILSANIPAGMEADVMLNHFANRKPKHIFITHADIDRFKNPDLTNVLAHNPELSRKYIENALREINFFVDEGHEAVPGMERVLADGHLLVTATATYTAEMEKLFGGPPAAQLTLYQAIKRKTCRDVHHDVVFLGNEDDAEAVAAQMVEHYYRGIDYIEEDNTPESAQKYLKIENLRERPDILKLGYARILDRVMSADEIRRGEMTNMAFSKYRDVQEALTRTYQGVYDGTFGDLDDMAKRISADRATSRIRQHWLLESRLFGSPDEPPALIDLEDPEIHQRFGFLIRRSTINGSGLQREARDVLRGKMADVLTRQAVGILLNDTPPDFVRPDQVSGVLRRKLTDIAKGATPEDAALRSTLTDVGGAPYRRIADVAGMLSDDARDRILGDMRRGKALSLIVESGDIDLRKFPHARYAACVESDNRNAEAIVALIDQGQLVHVVGNTGLATGFSHPDMLSLQRHVRQNVPEGPPRTVQQLGRIVRDRYSRARATVYGRKEVIEDGTFLFGDAMAHDFPERNRRYDRRFARGSVLGQNAL